jgi:hypothetical protein
MEDIIFSYKPAVVASCLCMPSVHQQRHISSDRHHEFMYACNRIRGFYQLSYEDRETIVIMIGQVYETLPLCCRLALTIVPHYKDCLLPEKSLARNGVIFSVKCLHHQKDNQSLAGRLNRKKKFYTLDDLLNFLVH